MNRRPNVDYPPLRRVGVPPCGCVLRLGQVFGAKNRPVNNDGSDWEVEGRTGIMIGDMPIETLSARMEQAVLNVLVRVSLQVRRSI